MSRLKAYLGDGVYADFNDCGQIVLSTEDGISATNTIYLESDVVESLERYVRNLRKVLEEERAQRANS